MKKGENKKKKEMLKVFMHFNRPKARKSAYAKASADKGGRKMNKIIGLVGLVGLVIFIFCAVPVFAGTEEENFGTLSGASYDDGKYRRVVEFREGSELRGEEADFFRDAFSKIKEKLPEKSYFEIVRFPEVSRYHVKFSNGHTYVAIGSGDTVRAAFNDLVSKISR